MRISGSELHTAPRGQAPRCGKGRKVDPLDQAPAPSAQQARKVSLFDHDPAPPARHARKLARFDHRPAPLEWRDRKVGPLDHSSTPSARRDRKVDLFDQNPRTHLTSQVRNPHSYAKGPTGTTRRAFKEASNTMPQASTAAHARYRKRVLQRMQNYFARRSTSHAIMYSSSVGSTITVTEEPAVEITPVLPKQVSLFFSRSTRTPSHSRHSHTA